MNLQVNSQVSEIRSNYFQNSILTRPLFVWQAIISTYAQTPLGLVIYEWFRHPT